MGESLKNQLGPSAIFPELPTVTWGDALASCIDWVMEQDSAHDGRALLYAYAAENIRSARQARPSAAYMQAATHRGRSGLGPPFSRVVAYVPSSETLEHVLRFVGSRPLAVVEALGDEAAAEWAVAVGATDLSSGRPFSA